MYSLHSSINVSKRNINPVFLNVPNSSVLIRLEKEQQLDNTGIFERSIDRGSQGKVRYSQNGILGQWISCPYGDTEILFSPPNPTLPIDIYFLPGYNAWSYTISILIPTPNPVFEVLTDKWGLDAGVLQTLPIQLLDLLLMINPSKSADTRNMIASIEAAQSIAAAAEVKASAADTKAETANTTLISVQSEMVEQRDFEVVAASFVLVGDKMVATVTHDLLGSKPQMSLVDGQGDEQGFSQLIAPTADTCKIELTQNQFDNAEFPLTLSIQGKNGSAVVVSSFLKSPTMAYHWRVLNGELQNSQDGVTALNASFAQGIVKAAIGGNGLLYIQNANGYFGLNDNDLAAGFVAASEGDYPTGDRIQFTLA